MTRGDDRRDPLVIFRAPDEWKARLYAHAAAQGLTVSEVARAAIDAILPAPPSDPPRRASAPPAKPASTRAKKPSRCEHRVAVGSYCRRCNRTV